MLTYLFHKCPETSHKMSSWKSPQDTTFPQIHSSEKEKAVDDTEVNPFSFSLSRHVLHSNIPRASYWSIHPSAQPTAQSSPICQWHKRGKADPKIQGAQKRGKASKTTVTQCPLFSPPHFTHARTSRSYLPGTTARPPKRQADLTPFFERRPSITGPPPPLPLPPPLPTPIKKERERAEQLAPLFLWILPLFVAPFLFWVAVGRGRGEGHPRPITLFGGGLVSFLLLCGGGSTSKRGRRRKALLDRGENFGAQKYPRNFGKAASKKVH